MIAYVRITDALGLEKWLELVANESTEIEDVEDSPEDEFEIRRRFC